VDELLLHAKIAGIVEDWVSYVCPVPAAQDYILDVIKDKTVANSPLVFPSAAADKLPTATTSIATTTTIRRGMTSTTQSLSREH